MAARGHCSICGKATRHRTLRTTGGLCFGCAHPDFWYMSLLILGAIGAVALVVALAYFRSH